MHRSDSWFSRRGAKFSVDLNHQFFRFLALRSNTVAERREYCLINLGRPLRARDSFGMGHSIRDGSYKTRRSGHRANTEHQNVQQRGVEYGVKIERVVHDARVRQGENMTEQSCLR